VRARAAATRTTRARLRSTGRSGAWPGVCGVNAEPCLWLLLSHAPCTRRILLHRRADGVVERIYRHGGLNVRAQVCGMSHHMRAVHKVRVPLPAPWHIPLYFCFTPDLCGGVWGCVPDLARGSAGLHLAAGADEGDRGGRAAGPRARSRAHSRRARRGLLGAAARAAAGVQLGRCRPSAALRGALACLSCLPASLSHLSA
jgi:hypothetical protein